MTAAFLEESMLVSSPRILAAIVSIGLITSLTLTASPLPVAAATANRLTAIVSLGDSYISGEAGRWQGNSNNVFGSRDGTDRAYVGQGTYDPTVVYGQQSYHNGCHRSDVAEVSPSSLPVPFDVYVNIACSGATTDKIWLDGKERAQADQLLKWATIPTQVEVVVLSIGGNDLDISGILEACGWRFMEGRGPCAPEAELQMHTRLAMMVEGVKRAIDVVRETMTTAGFPVGAYDFVLQSYPSPLPDAARVRYPETYQRYLTGGCPFYDEDLDWFSLRASPLINDTLRGIAAGKGVRFLDLSRAFIGREVCATTTHLVDQQHPVNDVTSEWARFVAGVVQGDKQESAHPNAIGQRALGQCLALFITSAFPAARCTNTPGRNYTGMRISMIS